MDLIKTESVFNLDALTEGKAYRVTVLSEGCEKGRKRDGILVLKRIDKIKFYFYSSAPGTDFAIYGLAITPYDIEHKRYKIEPLDVGTGKCVCTVPNKFPGYCEG